MPSALHTPTVALTLALGAACGLGARTIHLPLPMLLGPLLGVATLALSGARPLGHATQFPAAIRLFFIPIIGVAIGGNFTPAILAEAGGWWPSLLALCLFIPVAHLAGFQALKATGRLDPATAFFGTAPGGLIETVQMGEERGADVAMLTMLQFLRLILTIILVPVGFTLFTGHAVGSAGGATLAGSALRAEDLPWLIGAGLVGAALGRLTRLPAGMITGPILLSGAVHLAGLASGSPPRYLVDITQIVIGTSLGVRFAGMALRHFLLALRLAALNVTLTIVLAAGFAALLAPRVGEPVPAVFLAFAPGGLTEMSLIALSLHMSVVYVTAHHALRIILAVSVARIFSRRLTR